MGASPSPLSSLATVLNIAGFWAAPPGTSRLHHLESLGGAPRAPYSNSDGITSFCLPPHTSLAAPGPSPWWAGPCPERRQTVGSGAGCCPTPFHLPASPCSACAGRTLCAVWWDSGLLVPWLWSAASGVRPPQPGCGPSAHRLPFWPCRSSALLINSHPSPSAKSRRYLAAERLPQQGVVGGGEDSHSHHIQLLPAQHTHISVAIAGDRPWGTHTSPLGGSREPQSSRSTCQAGSLPPPQLPPQFGTLWGLQDTQMGPLSATDWFLYAEPTLYSWNKFYLIMRSLNSSICCWI